VQFVERSYGGKTFRPRPEIHFSADTRLLVVATPWGSRSGAKKVVEIIVDYYTSSLQDLEATSPFEKLSCLSPVANSLRIATLLANDRLYREENKSEFTVGVELFVAAIDRYDVVFVQVGHPNILLGRQGRGLIPLGSHMDLALDVSGTNKILSPLPSHMIGLDPSANMTIGSFRPQTNDQLVLISRSAMSDRVYLLSQSEWNLEVISRSLSENHPDLAFWAGLLSL
jgi:hypothetical protein